MNGYKSRVTVAPLKTYVDALTVEANAISIIRDSMLTIDQSVQVVAQDQENNALRSKLAMLSLQVSDQN